ncbi:putative Hydroxyproline-rich glycoprotein family protein [Hibiscus syriacus]|uniref:Hydroxyproline-rich glycoprotein family protein n=1 Tax=Hibiscus syriacus TaxID=106335 RepID=A0A6A2ZPF3_HIBSY|nr:putative Hydroxyproline-rich glycoprotein family protein [Hibiscus syriacus]
MQLRPDATAYNVVIRLFCMKGGMDMADKLMKEISLIDLHPDMITCFKMIKGFCNAGKLEDACELFRTIRRQGFSPNVVAYSVLLEGVCEYGSTKKAMEVLGEMEKAGGSCSPNIIPYTSVIKTFREKGRIMEALWILDRMGACGMNRHDEAEKLFRKMLATGAKPDGIASSITIREICWEGRLLDGFCLYDEIERTQYLSSINSDIYCILLVGLCQQSHSVEAAKLVRSTFKKKIRSKAPYVGKIIEHMKNSGDKELVSRLSKIPR